MSAEANPAALADLLREKRVLALCGPGGVGKTTTAAALALAAAQSGRRVLLLTIDPAKRLAEALGLSIDAPRPVPVPAESLSALGLGGAGALDAWMLEPRVVFDDLVRRLSPPEQATKVLGSRLYRHLSELISGLQEYTAAEALYTFANSGTYDLIVLDTPPSRNALEFLDAPGRLARFLEDGVVELFVPRERTTLVQRAGRLVGSVFARVLGATFVDELEAFIGAFAGMFGALREHTAGVRALLGSSEAAFLLVTTTDDEALREARYFRDAIVERGLPFAGYVLNRSLARLEGWSHPSELATAGHASPELQSALAKLGAFADVERSQAQRHLQLLEALRAEAGHGRLAVAAPLLVEGAGDLRSLWILAQGLSGS